jgi:hypothetical protein
MKQTCRLLVAIFFLTACGGQRDQQESGAALAAARADRDRESRVVREIFSQRYFENYRSRRCGENIMQFVQALDEVGVDLDPFRVITIENKGGSMMGLVRAEAARSVRWGRPAVWDRNWGHHAILVDVRGHIVYDFDYLIAPTPVRLEEYIERMFLVEPGCTTQDPYGYAMPCIGREIKLDEYRWEAVPAKDALSRNDENKTSFMMRDVLTRLE